MYVYIHIYTHMNRKRPIHMCINIYIICMYAHIYIYTHTNACMYTYIYIHTRRGKDHRYVNIYVWKETDVSWKETCIRVKRTLFTIHTSLFICVNFHIGGLFLFALFLHKCMCIYIYVYIHTHMKRKRPWIYKCGKVFFKTTKDSWYGVAMISRID